jgi:hypothetical protein
LNLFAPESTVCDAAVTRLRRRASPPKSKS